MQVEIHRADFRDIESMRDIYRPEMSCQVIHDSIHSRSGWTHEYIISDRGAPVGYASVAVSGPWKDNPTVYEYFVLPQYRLRLVDLFAGVLTSSRAKMIETQSNDSLLTVMVTVHPNNLAQLRKRATASMVA